MGASNGRAQRNYQRHRSPSDDHSPSGAASSCFWGQSCGAARGVALIEPRTSETCAVIVNGNSTAFLISAPRNHRAGVELASE